MTIFRQASLDRLASPEQLDTLLEVTTPKGWLALLALLSLIMAAILWSVIGSLPTHVSGVGILVKKGGLSSISALGSGQLTELLVKAGDDVKPGQEVARLLLPDLNSELNNARASLRALTAQHEHLESFGGIDSRLQVQAIAQQRRMATDQIAVARERQVLFQNRLGTQQKLLEEGLVTDQVLQATRDSLLMARAEAERAKSTLRELEVRRTGLGQTLQREREDRTIHLDELQRRVRDLEQKILQSSLVVSPAAGRVIEVRAAVGTLVAAGTPIVMIEVSGEQAGGLLAIVYVPGLDGKKVHAGMSVEISPSSVKREEHGAMRAAVTTVSEFPATNQAMLAKLGNQELAASFFRAIESPIELRVDLLESRRTVSGYRWTSPKGPPHQVQPGTLCTALITVRERAPITLVVPALRRLHLW